MNYVLPGASADSYALTVEIGPVSVQANGEARERFKAHVRSVNERAAFLLSGDVRLHVDWLVSSRARYETDRTPDLDNILKPLIDALSGPAGLLIDDNQIQALSCGWVDVGRGDESLQVELRFQPGEWLPKEGLRFVQFHDGLCMPVPSWNSLELERDWFQFCQRAMAIRREADEKGVPYEFAQLLMPSQRVFHRTRLAAFRVLTEQEFMRGVAREA
jgi:hypothetical protein